MAAFDFRSWLTSGFSNLSLSSLKKLYSSTLHNVRKRQKNIAKGEFANTELGRQAIQTRTYTLAELGSREAIERELMRLQHFMSLKQTSVKGLRSIRKRTIDSLKASGYTFVNKSNLDSFGAFMESYKKYFGESIGSPTPQELKPFEDMIKKLDPEEIKEQFENFLEGAESI